MMIRITCYRVRPDADPAEFIAFERRVAAEYAAVCATFGWHSLGTYEIVGAVPNGANVTHADIYAVEGDDPEAAIRREEEAPIPPPDPEGMDAICDECRSFMTGPEDRLPFWLLDGRGQPSEATPLGPRTIVLTLDGDSPGSLGTYRVDGIDGVSVCAVDLTDVPFAGDRNHFVFRPVTVGAAVVPPLT